MRGYLLALGGLKSTKDPQEDNSEHRDRQLSTSWDISEEFDLVQCCGVKGE